MKLNLNDVTLCVADCVTPALSLLAIEKSQKLCKFKNSVLFTDVMLSSRECDIVSINKLASVKDYSRFILKELGSYICTDFVLIVQWDGYVLDANAWRDEFRNYDYIGAKWAWHLDGANVGNGGFSLRSKRLLDATSHNDFVFHPELPEDEQICRSNREFLLDKFSIKIAPEEIADAFSYERTYLNKTTFGFHGLFNMWRHCEDHEMVALINELSPATWKSPEFLELMIHYFALQKRELVRLMYAKNQSQQSKLDFVYLVALVTKSAEFADAFFNICESLVFGDPS
jgi:hypothetical protein